MQDFGNIKTVFNDILIEGIINKDSKKKKLFKQYLKTIKESEILRSQFLVYNNIETRVDNDFNSASLFVTENLKVLSKYNIEDITKENKKLTDLLGSNTTTTTNKLHEALSYLIFTKPTARNVSKISNEIKNVIDYIKDNKPKEINEAIELPYSLVSSIMVQKYNDKYSNLSEEDKSVLNVLISSDLESKKNLYGEKLKECVDMVDKILEHSDGESKDKLAKVKKKLLEEGVVNDNQLEDKITKLIELKNNLME